MSDASITTLWFIGLVIVVVACFWLAVAGENVEERIDLPGRECYVERIEDNRIFGDDTVTTTIYCKVES